MIVEMGVTTVPLTSSSENVIWTQVCSGTRNRDQSIWEDFYVAVA